MVSTRVASVSLVALLLFGCTAVIDSGEATRSGFQSDGSYVLSEKEQSMNCGRLEEQATWHLAEMKNLAGKEQKAREDPPGTVIKAVTRVLMRKKSESTHIKQYRREFAVVSAVNVALVERGCPTVDFASRLDADAKLLGIPVEY